MLFRSVLALISFVLVSPTAVYASGQPAVAEEGGISSIYIPLKPAFVVNYGGAGRLKYIKADISLRLQSNAAADSVRHHMPYIRNNLVMLFSAQSDESISSQEGKEALRQEALQVVKDVIRQEDQTEGVVDLYFNVFLIQK
jgi:flagellar FliL protein